MQGKKGNKAMNKKSVSIRRLGNGTFSVDIRSLDEHGLTSAGGTGRLFRWVGDALIWIKVQVGRDIPATWPSIEAHDFASGDYQQSL